MAARQVTDDELEILLDSEWGSRITAAWLIGIDRRAYFRDVLGDLLSRSVNSASPARAIALPSPASAPRRMPGTWRPI
ncbi:DUF6000 family protein [Embleya sp. NBC_00896]|uniref:DUF6000 family protein n=1 Tax=Embleya sp. NBC_00896 TaxID=2975961 RepID=UPI003866BDAD|nr:DUF6000 family protein [Embleya sp. NBC_00896]